MSDLHPLLIPEIARGSDLNTAVEKAAAAATGRFMLTGVRGGSLAPFLTRFQARLCAPIVVIVADPAGVHTLAGDLEYHRRCLHASSEKHGVLLFPPNTLSPYDELTPERRHAIERSAVLFQLVLRNDWRFLVISAESLARKIVPLPSFEACCMPISRGDRIDRNDMLQRLEQGGYYRAPLVEEPGTYALRGSLIDLFPPYLSRPARIDLIGSEVERIRLFDTATQASEEDIEELWLHPTNVGFLTQGREAHREISDRLRSVCDEVDQPTTKTAQLIDDLLSGRLFLGKERFAPAFHSRLGDIFDYLPNDAVFCMEDHFAVKGAWQKLHHTLSREYETFRSAGVPAFPPDRHLLGEADIEARFAASRLVAVQSLTTEEISDDETVLANADTCDLSAESTNTLNDRLRAGAPEGEPFDIVSRFCTYIKAVQKCGYRTTVVTHTPGQAERLVSMLKGRGLGMGNTGDAQTLRRPGITVTSGELNRGCILPGDGLAWIAEEEAFGRRTRRKRHAGRTISDSLADIRSLNPGDLVVHVEHGLGRYEGLVRQRVRSSEMDFLLLSYRDGDKLYLPVYRLNQIQKYRGGGPEQRLDKLGGQSFQQSLSKAKRATQEIAISLLSLYARRMEATRKPFDDSDELYREFEASFPFEETDDQARAIDETMADMGRECPMDRLVCGDVGFGKTEVAMRAAFRAAMNGSQTAVLVPTTVLAQQHYQTFTKRFAPYPIRIERLSRFRTDAENRDTVLALKNGTVDIVIGTHRLLSKDVHFKNLGLLVIDEEHRFGVAHKERIRTLRASVDTLVLTATPIPRTLQMAFGGIRDLSLIGTAPALRRPIKTVICHDDPKVLTQAMTLELNRGGQVFFVHNRVKDIAKIAQRVQRMMPEARIIIGHGQMKEDALERVMLDFVAGRYDILVCTSIIESGLDISRANTIIINRADQFGMAQLYQLRGRVGRSSEQAHAYLVIPPLSMLANDARERVETLARYTDLGSGFSVATMDLELRGAGNLIGAEQSGNVAAVGIEMFCQLLEEATADLRGNPLTPDIEPELTLDRPGYIPEDFVPDVGQRLAFYKRLASATDEREAEQIAAELTDRYGTLPKETEDLITGMTAKAMCHALGIRGLEVTRRGLTVHLAPDSKVDPDTVIEMVREARGLVELTDDLRIKAYFSDHEEESCKTAIRFLHRLEGCDNNLLIS